MIGLFLFFLDREQLQHFVDHFAHAFAMRGGDGARVAQTQLEELGGHHRARHAFDLVHRHIHRALGLAQTLRNDLVLRGQAGAAINDKDNGVGFIDGLQGLAGHLMHDAVVDHRLEAPGIDDQIRPIAHTAMAVVAITGQARIVGDQRITRFGQPVEQRGFTTFGADKGNGWLHASTLFT